VKDLSDNEEVVAEISGSGDTDLVVCKPGKKEKICTPLDEESSMSSINRNSSRLGENMLDNNTYDIMEQLTNETKSLWRIKNSYLNDAAEDNEIKELWAFIEKDKEELVKILTEKLRERV